MTDFRIPLPQRNPNLVDIICPCGKHTGQQVTRGQLTKVKIKTLCDYCQKLEYLEKRLEKLEKILKETDRVING